MINTYLHHKYNNENFDFKITNKKQKLINISNYQKDLEKHIEFGLKLIQNLDTFFLQGDIQIKKKLVSSILDEKMEFNGVKYRTPNLRKVIGISLRK